MDPRRLLVAATLGALSVGCACSDPDPDATDAAAGDAQVADGSAGTDAASEDTGVPADVDGGPPVDECAEGTDDCPDGARCVDDPVGFHCACEPPQVGDGTTCVDAPTDDTVAVGRFHTCAILGGGAVRCFGQNLYGQLGDGQRRAPDGNAVDVALPAPAVAVAAGDVASCAVLETGALHCWGSAFTTGVATTSLGVYPPTRVGTESDWRAVAFLGPQYACGLRGASELWCWGNAIPPIGSGTGLVAEPRLVDAPVDWVALVTPLCGITPDARLECWDDTAGAFADAAPGIAVARASGDCLVDTGGRLHCLALPFGVESDATTGRYQRVALFDDWVDVAENNAGFCGLRSDGRVHCAGQQFPRARQDALPDTVAAPEPVVAVVRGGFVTQCAIGLSGAVFCWGSNSDGQVGLGTRGAQPEPVRVGDALYASVSGGYFDTCAARTAGDVDCWGEVTRLGDTPAPEYVDEPALHHAGDFAQVATGEPLRILRARDGALFAAGSGPLGLGSDVSVATEPTRIGTRSGWTRVAARAREHACGIVDGELWCWGDGSDGQLGVVPEPTGFDEPVRVGTESDWTAVSVAAGNTCGLRAGALFCFGADYGRDGGLVRVGEALGTFTAVGVDRDSACGVADGALYCWGSNSSEERVPGGSSRLEAPTQVGADTDWTDVALGELRTCGLRGAGELYCWGAGFGGVVDFDAPTRVGVTRIGDASDWTAALVRGSHACGLRGAGELYCWGASDNGALGHGTAWVDAPTPIATP